jgi:[glutamine synthetase] adenylyltransferase / [glutamine synthetase]-adenylyl-L-tyrosine phosphorylase
MAHPPSEPFPPLPAACLGLLPAPLRGPLERHWRAYAGAAADRALALPTEPGLLESVCRVWPASEFASRACTRDPALLAELVASGDLRRAYRPGELAARVEAALGPAGDHQALGVALRALRLREMVRIAWRDLAGWADLAETLGELSDLADACLDGALCRLHGWQVERHGTPRDPAGAPLGLVVLGMGKLGARELNFSSDIDLIFAYASEGETDGARALSNAEFFTRLGQALIAALDAPSADGRVFRVDMRLRPYGESGPLAMSFDAMEDYYQVHGREWERYAMIKARVAAGDRAAGERLLEQLRPFVYRRYLDFGAFESLREMKERIAREVRRKGLQRNIKLGPGGIREVEFIAQAFQLIRGGREPELRERGLLRVLDSLAERGHLPDYVTRGLAEAYVFLRRVENRLQAYADRQTHVLPAAESERLALAWSMGCEEWSSFERELEKRRRLVQSHFQQVFAAPQADDDAARAELVALWRGTLAEAPAREVLVKAGYDDPAEAARLLGQLRDGHANRALAPLGRERMDRLMPLLIGAAGSADRPTSCLLRLIGVIEAIAGRSAYLALLVENPMGLSQLVKLCAASPWIAALLARHPLLLDELLDPRTLYAPLDRAGLERELRGALAEVAPDDLEQQMEVLRHFRQANTLRVAAADVAEVMPLMVVSDHLTEIAEVVLGEVLALAWHHLTHRHGRPRCRLDGEPREPAFAVIAYGKLGGIELGYGSDLDLVFLHDSEGEEQQTEGPKPIDNAVFFARLGQRIIHILSVHTPAGVLYEVDARLRPSGASGLLVSSLAAFGDYQRTQAWTWEHQALVRARVVAGDAGIAGAFSALRREVLCRPRDAAALRAEVREMRERMRVERGPRRSGWFDLKHDRGGIADVEFMVQYGVLAWAHRHPELVRYTDNIRQLDGLAEAALMPPADARSLAAAYRVFRARLHRLTLQNEPARVEEGELRKEREAVIRIWREWMEKE